MTFSRRLAVKAQQKRRRGMTRQITPGRLKKRMKICKPAKPVHEDRLPIGHQRQTSVVAKTVIVALMAEAKKASIT